MRLHCLGVPHTITSPDYTACAFTAKVSKFIDMMSARGHTLYHYGHQRSLVNCENITCTTDNTLKAAYGDFDHRKGFFQYDINDIAYRTFTGKAIGELRARYRPGDIVLPFFGFGHKAIIDQVPEMIAIEPGIGYPSGPFCRWKVFESYAILHAYMGLKAVERANPDWYNAVIPNYFDPLDFTYRDTKDDYFLFLGRVYDGKGVQIAIDVTKHIGAKLIIAGQTDGSIQFPDHVEYVGYADKETRRQLLSKAKATFCPSLYLEPFCGVAVESLFSGTPVITTDWGAFSEYVVNSKNGYRCRTLRDFVRAAEDIHTVNPSFCHYNAMERFSYAAVAPMYERFFQDVLDVHFDEGWTKLD